MKDSILLADFIDKVRDELTIAVNRRQEQKRRAESSGTADLVGDLELNEVVIEANVAAHRETKGGISITLLGMLGGSGERQRGTSASHKVTIHLTTRGLAPQQSANAPGNKLHGKFALAVPLPILARPELTKRGRPPVVARLDLTEGRRPPVVARLDRTTRLK